MALSVRNVTKLMVVFSLWTGEKHGYEIIKEIENKTGKKPSTSQIYPFLKELEARGLVEVEITGDRGKKVYSLTDRGRKYVDSKLEMFSDIISSTIKRDMTTCAHCGCKVYEGGHTEKIEGRELKFCCRHCAWAFKEGR